MFAKKRKKPGYAFGAQLNEQQMGLLNTGTGMIGGAIDMLDPVNEFGARSTGGAIAGGALKGAAAGAAFGPIGAGVGAVVGGVTSFMGNKKAKSAQEEAKRKMSAQLAYNAMNYGDRLAYGGKLKKKLGLIHGGELNQISPDAVEVNATNPGEIDSVELDSAMVDDGEIIDNKERVFSDLVRAPSGRTVAQEAKILEKMKSNRLRFQPANDMIETKLDKLFQYQQANNNRVKEYTGMPFKRSEWKAGNTDRNYKTHPLTAEEIKGWTNELKEEHLEWQRDMAKSKLGKGGTLKTKKAVGGIIDPKPPLKDVSGFMQPVFNLDKPWMPSYQQDGFIWDQQTDSPESIFPTAKRGDGMVSGVDDPFKVQFGNPSIPSMAGSTQQQYPSRERIGPDWNKIGTLATTFAPNIVNQFLNSKLKGPASPTLETETRLGRISAAPQLNEVGTAFRDAQNAISRGTAQTSTLLSGTGSLMAKKLQATNQVYGDVNRQNTAIGNQEASINAGVRARNAGRSSQFRQDQADFSNKKKMLTSQNISNLSEKLLAMGREKNQISKDIMEYKILAKAYEDSGVNQRASDPIIQEYLDKLGYNRPRRKKK